MFLSRRCAAVAHDSGIRPHSGRWVRLHDDGFPDASRARRAGFWSTLRLGARMMMRDARAGELRLLVLALVVAVAAVTSVGFLADRVGRALERDAGQMLGPTWCWTPTSRCRTPSCSRRASAGSRYRAPGSSRPWSARATAPSWPRSRPSSRATRCAARCAWPRAVRAGRAGARHSLRGRGLGRRPAAVAAESEDRRPAQRGRHAPAHRAGGELRTRPGHAVRQRRAARAAARQRSAGHRPDRAGQPHRLRAAGRRSARGRVRLCRLAGPEPQARPEAGDAGIWPSRCAARWTAPSASCRWWRCWPC